MSTEENLKKAFAGESQANRKYLAFAKKADEEGHKQIAKLFRAAAESETVHALNHLRVLGEVKDTETNLKKAIEGETEEFTKMYPAMIAEAEKENNAAAKMSFSSANSVEKIHAELYKKALKQLISGKEPKEQKIHVCQVCGYTVEGVVPETCPVCGSLKTMFKNIE